MKRNSSDTIRVWWIPILTRGKFHIEVLPDDFPGETPAGAAMMAASNNYSRTTLFRYWYGILLPPYHYCYSCNIFYRSYHCCSTDPDLYSRSHNSHRLRRNRYCRLRPLGTILVDRGCRSRGGGDDAMLPVDKNDGGRDCDAERIRRSHYRNCRGIAHAE